MSGLNLGTEAIACLREMQQSLFFQRFREHFATFAARKLYEAVSSPVDQRVEATAYARALRDIWIAFESAALDKPQRMVELPPASLLDEPGQAQRATNPDRPGRLAKALATPVPVAQAGNSEGII